MAEFTHRTGAHLVGSIPVDTAEAAFRLAVENLGDHLKRVPDGEVGERDTWIRWQYAKIGASPQLAALDIDNPYVPVRPFGIVDGVSSADEIELPDLGYAAAAIESYGVFERLCNQGVIPDSVRFQVGLPTPVSVSLFYVATESRPLFEVAYQRALGDEFERMLTVIPAERLSIQWETVSEFALLEGLLDNHFDGDIMENVTSRVAALVDLVPTPVEVGLHLCYGDSGHKHFCEPADAGFLAALTNSVLVKSQRVIAWVHMPVPKARNDAAYFEPLASLDMPASTELYLGLVHHTDGFDGSLGRALAARAVKGRFGVATECGLGRREPDTIPALLRQHADVLAALHDADNA